MAEAKDQFFNLREVLLTSCNDFIDAFFKATDSENGIKTSTRRRYSLFGLRRQRLENLFYPGRYVPEYPGRNHRKDKTKNRHDNQLDTLGKAVKDNILYL